MSIYDYSIERADGSVFLLSELKGKVLLIVNTATRCGFTPQYKELEELYEKYHDKGLEIIDIPCNQFGNQTPESDEEIAQFCTLNYKTQFAQMKKADVNGADELPLYTYLKANAPINKGISSKFFQVISKSTKTPEDIKWNFTKFLIDQEGNIVDRFEPTTKMEEVENAIARLIDGESEQVEETPKRMISKKGIAALCAGVTAILSLCGILLYKKRKK